MTISLQSTDGFWRLLDGNASSGAIRVDNANGRAFWPRG